MDNSVTILPYRAPSTSVSLETRSSPVLNEYSNLLPLLPVEINESDTKIIHPLWSRVPLFSNVNLNAISPKDACFLPSSITCLRGVLKNYLELGTVSWERVTTDVRHPVLNMRTKPLDFPDSLSGTVLYDDCIDPACFIDQRVTESSALVTRGSWFSPGHVEVGGAAGFAYLLTGIKIWCFSYSSLTAAVLLERSLQTPPDFIHRMQRAPREKEAAGIQFAVQRPGDLLYVPHLTAHSVLTFDLGTTTILAGWDCCNISKENLIVQLFDNFSPGGTRERWREQFRLGGFDSFKKWCLELDPDSEMYQHAENLEKWCPKLVKNISVSARKSRKRKYNFDRK